MSYSQLFRKRAVARVKSGQAVASVARDVGVDYSTLSRWCKEQGIDVQKCTRHTKKRTSHGYNVRIRACLQKSLSEYPEFITAGDFAKIFKISRIQVYRLIEQEELLAFKIGNSYRIPKQELIDRLSGTSSNDVLIG